ncbi:MAG: DegV family protein [Firmicutes bacterium]|nr:DegV family protein [Bacillota bacterium]
MSKITISVDNTSDLGPELFEKHDLKVIYFGIAIGDKLFRDTEVTPDDIYNAVEKDNLVPKTNAALEVDYRELFEQSTKDGGSIIHLNMSGALSASHSNALRAAKGLERVTVIDTQNGSLGTGILAIHAAELAKSGKSVTDITKIITDMVTKVDTSFILNDLKYLHKGGRASTLKLLGANLLKIRASLRVDEAGKIVPDKKFKGQFDKSVKEWTEYKLSQPCSKDVVYVLHTDTNNKIIGDTVQAYKDAGYKDVQRVLIGPTLTIHIGRNAMGVVRIRE